MVIWSIPLCQMAQDAVFLIKSFVRLMYYLGYFLFIYFTALIAPYITKRTITEDDGVIRFRWQKESFVLPVFSNNHIIKLGKIELRFYLNEYILHFRWGKKMLQANLNVFSTFKNFFRGLSCSKVWCSPNVSLAPFLVYY